MRKALWKRYARLQTTTGTASWPGLDPERTEFVYGTDYQLKPEYMLKILQIARNTTLNRAKRSMDEVSRSAENPMVSQMIYPLMQAIDIADLHIDLAVAA